MSRSSAAKLVLVLALAVGVVLGAAEWWTRPRVVEAGSTVVLVEGRELGLGGEDVAGVGVEGVLGLVGDTCVGLLPPNGEDGSVVVWPSGTTVAGSGRSLSITSQGQTVRLGDEIDAGTEEGMRFPELSGRLPEGCEEADLIALWLGG